ncbi:Venom allergen 5 [Habropoda laboriosa]|uniref:Venom allergen 5 n=1 Tax=Habropoda laboriosa TaxID=597456 RepID=A0A0L7QSK0_9HYME|nr:Venom allergen 5 [Habropoda laboriosa]
MKEMLWDDELAAIAQRWANRCAEIHDNLRNVRRFAVGQNIARTWTTRPPGLYDDQPDWRQRISDWFNEVQHYTTGYSETTGHYTQVGNTSNPQKHFSTPENRTVVSMEYSRFF